MGQSKRHERIDEIAAEYMQALSSGQRPSRDRLQSEFADLMPELAEALDGAERVAQARQEAGDAPGERSDSPSDLSTASLESREREVRELIEDARPEIFRDWIPGYSILVPQRSEDRLEGGQGTVYKATQDTTGRRVAIKILNQHTNESARRRFEREIDLISKFKHANIVTIHNSGETRLGQPFFVMELVENALPIDQYVHGKNAQGQSEREKLSLEQTLALFDQVCDAVAYAHQKGVIHRDLKPANILIQSENIKSADGKYETKATPKVVDFGLAKSDSGLAQRPRFTSPRGVERAIGPAMLRAHDFVAEHACVC